MRLSREAKAQHHEAITSAASKMLRERGIERTSVIDLMQAVGLTHGGFYRHFKSKDELVASSASKAFEEVVQQFEKRTAEAGPQAPLVAYVLEYLSDLHRDDPALGCFDLGVRSGGASGRNQLSEKPSQTASANCSTLWQRDCPVRKKNEPSAPLSLVMAGATNDEELWETVFVQRHSAARCKIIEEKV